MAVPGGNAADFFRMSENEMFVIPDELNLIPDKLRLLAEPMEPEPLIWRCTIDNDNLLCAGQNAKDRFKGTRKVVSNGDNSVVVGQTGKLDQDTTGRPSAPSRLQRTSARDVAEQMSLPAHQWK